MKRKRYYEIHIANTDANEIHVDDAEKAERDELFVACRFQDLGLCDTLSDYMHVRMGFSSPTRIQQAGIPLILSERDVLIKAETGTGKTIVYLAPIVHKLQARLKKVNRTEGTYALVLVPTRELCLQVYEVMKQLVHRFHWLVPGYVMGGENRSKEKARLRKGITILIATPGRLLDHLQNTSSFCHDNLQWIVFDEADRLLDLGFGKDIKNILTLVQSHHSSSYKNQEDRRRKQQHLLLSATLGEDVKELVSLSLRNPVMAGLTESQARTSEVLAHKDATGCTRDANSPLEYTIPTQLVQTYITVPCNLRLVAILAVLRMWNDTSSSHKAVVFFSTCDSVDFHYALLNEFHWGFLGGEEGHQRAGFLDCKSFRLHGNMSQKERTETFNEFNKEASAFLLSTDVAARGLDIPKVSHIIQYDPPGDANEYVHRVGRTARLGQKGQALLFLQPCEVTYLSDLNKHGVTLTELPLQRIWGFLDAGNKKAMIEADGSLEMHPVVLTLQKTLETFISKQAVMRHLAADAFRSYVRSYAVHRGDLKMVFQLKKLHLGHVAKSFGLCDRPSLLGKSSNKQKSRRAKGKALKRTKKECQASCHERMTISESFLLDCRKSTLVSIWAAVQAKGLGMNMGVVFVSGQGQHCSELSHSMCSRIGRYSKNEIEFNIPFHSNKSCSSICNCS